MRRTPHFIHTLSRGLLPVLLGLGILTAPAVTRGQSVFPLPGWFEDNIVRPPVPERQGEASDFLSGLMQRDQVGLTEADAVQMVLESNLDVVVERFDPRMSEYEIDMAYRLFDPTLSMTLGANRDTRPLTTTFLTGTETQTSLSHNVNVGVSKLFETGTLFGVDYTSNRVSDNNLRNFLNPYWRASLTASISQPLLRNFGLLPNTRLIRIARNNKDISQHLFEQQVVQLVNQVQNLYWDLVFAGKDVEVRRKSLDLAVKTNEDNKRMAEIGTLAPIEVVQSEAEIANRRELLIRAEYSLAQMEDQMKKLISSLGDPGRVAVRIVPLDSLATMDDFRDFDLVQAVSYAIEQRPEIKQQRKRIDNAGIDLKYFRNQLLPDVRFNVSYGTAALEGVSRVFEGGGFGGLPFFGGTPVVAGTTGLGEAFNRLLGSDFPTYGASISVEIPLSNRSRRADYARASVARRQSEKRLRALEQQIALEVRNAHTQLEMNRARIEATQKARELAERNLEAEQKKFQLGTSQIRFVLEEQVRLAEAQTNEVNAQVSFTKAKRDLDRAMGKTLEMQNIRIGDAIAGKVARGDVGEGTPGS
jgi:outer membrane protein TolC